jgi:Ran GTPase-activating protein (RanGAP) involved in mRNA processing and transport
MLNIHLERKDFHGDWINNIVQILINHMTLKTLDLSNSWIRGTGGVIAPLLTHNTNLTALKLGNCGLLNSDASEIFQTLSMNKALITLNLCFNLLEEGLRGKYVANALRKNTSLRALDLSGIKINVSNLKSITETLTQTILSYDSSLGGVKHYQPQFLRALNLGSMSLGDIGAEHIGIVLSTNTVLTELNLEKNNISALGVDYITQALSNNKTLTMLDLRGNQINNKGKKALKKLNINNALNVIY